MTTWSPSASARFTAATIASGSASGPDLAEQVEHAPADGRGDGLGHGRRVYGAPRPRTESTGPCGPVTASRPAGMVSGRRG